LRAQKVGRVSPLRVFGMGAENRTDWLPARSDGELLNRVDLIRTDEARVARIVLSPNEITGRHYHSKVVEHVICLGGCVEVHEVENGMHVTKLVPGKIHELRPGVVHQLVNALETESEYLLVQKGNYDFESVDSY
jgi:quercetin dioxygenase-like cupin family protein